MLEDTPGRPSRNFSWPLSGGHCYVHRSNERHATSDQVYLSTWHVARTDSCPRMMFLCDKMEPENFLPSCGLPGELLYESPNLSDNVSDWTASLVHHNSVVKCGPFWCTDPPPSHQHLSHLNVRKVTCKDSSFGLIWLDLVVYSGYNFPSLSPFCLPLHQRRL